MPEFIQYVVFDGRKTGIFESVEEAKQLVQGYSGKQYQGFKSYYEALRALTLFHEYHGQMSINSTSDILNCPNVT